MKAAGRGGAVCRRGLRRGAASRAFSAADLLLALRHADTHAAHTVYADVDSEGYVMCAGGGGGGAVLCARAELAHNHHTCSALLTVADDALHSHTGHTMLRLVVVAPHAPHEALRLWPAERLLARAAVPHLTPRHIRGEGEYVCGACGAVYPEPYPLKVHLFLRCAPPEPRRFWRHVCAALRPPSSPATAATADPARLEALAAEWGGGAHACLYCGKLYSRKYGLKIHIRTHTGYRPLRCGHCARAFADPSNLNKHVRLHAARGDLAPSTRPAPCPTLRCPVCGRAQARRRDLERHLRTHAPP